MQGKESVPSILESDATGKVAEIYADIRQVPGTSIVNLIWPTSRRYRALSNGRGLPQSRFIEGPPLAMLRPYDARSTFPWCRPFPTTRSLLPD